MHDNYVYMQDIIYMRDNYVYMQDDYVCIITFFSLLAFFMESKKYVVISLRRHRMLYCAFVLTFALTMAEIFQQSALDTT